MRTIAAVLACLLLETGTAGAADLRPPAKSEPLVCPAGPPAAVFMLLVRCDDHTAEAVFDSRTARLMPSRFDFRADAVKRELVKISNRSAKSFDVGYGLVRFSGMPTPDSYLTEEGDGTALATAIVAGDTIVLAACSVIGGGITEHLVTEALTNDEILLLRLRLDGQPHIMALQVDDPRDGVAADVPEFSKRFERKHEGFQKSMKGIMGPSPTMVRPKPASGVVADCVRPGY